MDIRCEIIALFWCVKIICISIIGTKVMSILLTKLENKETSTSHCDISIVIQGEDRTDWHVVCSNTSLVVYTTAATRLFAYSSRRQISGI